MSSAPSRLQKIIESTKHHLPPLWINVYSYKEARENFIENSGKWHFCLNPLTYRRELINYASTRPKRIDEILTINIFWGLKNALTVDGNNEIWVKNHAGYFFLNGKNMKNGFSIFQE